MRGNIKQANRRSLIVPFRLCKISFATRREIHIHIRISTYAYKGTSLERNILSLIERKNLLRCLSYRAITREKRSQ